MVLSHREGLLTSPFNLSFRPTHEPGDVARTDNRCQSRSCCFEISLAFFETLLIS